MIGRMGGGAKGTHPSAFKPRATARPMSITWRPFPPEVTPIPSLRFPPLPTLARALTFAI